MMKLVEESAGIGELLSAEVALARVPYRVRRFQGFNDASDLPIPGLHRIEGIIEFGADFKAAQWIGVPLRLRIETGSMLGITLISEDGRILSEGHGPSKCLCC